VIGWAITYKVVHKLKIIYDSIRTQEVVKMKTYHISVIRFGETRGFVNGYIIQAKDFSQAVKIAEGYGEVVKVALDGFED
jgi:hypothetical protein